MGEALESAPPDALSRDEGEEAFDLIEPTRVSGDEMNMPVGARLQPARYGGRLVGGIVVEHEVNFKVRRNFSLDLTEEGKELLAAVARLHLSNDPSGGDIERGEERSRAMAEVIVAASLWLAGAKGQNGLSTLQRLDLTLLVDTKHQSVLRRVEIKPRRHRAPYEQSGDRSKG